MTVQFIRWGLTSGRGTGDDGTARHHVSHAAIGSAFNSDTQPNALAGLVAPATGLYDVHLEAVRVVPPSNVEVSAQDFLEGSLLGVTHRVVAADPSHSLDSSAGTTTPPLSDTTYGGIATMEIELPYPYVRISGAALTAWDAAAPTTATLAVTYTDRFPEVTRGAAEFGGFIDDGIDATGVAITGAKLLAALTTGGTPYKHTSQGLSITVLECIHAGPSPTGEIWVRSSGLGTNPNQIPPSAGSNTPERYGFHPAAFMRRVPSTATSLVRVNRRAAGITATRGPLAVWRVDRVPTHSRWLISLDGVPMTVVVAHPIGLDLRTPAEIWRGVWVPAITSGGAGSLPIFDVTASGGAWVFTVLGHLLKAAIGTLDFARFIECYDADKATPITTLITQTV